MRTAILRLTGLAALCALPGLVPGAPESPGRRWFKGNLHAHTVNSDGDSTPAAVVEWYREHDYQFLVLTDHNYLTDTGELGKLYGAREKFLLIPG